MYIVTLKDQLGNQMFAYTAIKCLAIDKHEDFGVIEENSYYNNSKDKKYGNSIVSIFEIPKSETVELSIPENFKVVSELSLKKRRGDYCNYIRNIDTNDKNVVFDGHFISFSYFTRTQSEIKKWFQFPAEILDKATKLLQNIKERRNSEVCCSVHFRVGSDYRKLGYLMEQQYWTNAALEIKKKYKNCCFVVFYDEKTKEVEKFVRQFDATEMHGSLVEDMAAISLCDIHIVCNSTFSIMSAYLSDTYKCSIRPAIYYSGIHKLPSDAFPSEWWVCPCKRNVISYISGMVYTGYVGIRNIMKMVRNRVADIKVGF